MESTPGKTTSSKSPNDFNAAISTHIPYKQKTPSPNIPTTLARTPINMNRSPHVKMFPGLHDSISKNRAPKTTSPLVYSSNTNKIQTPKNIFKTPSGVQYSSPANRTPSVGPTPNPFEAHLMDRMDMPMFSPNVFAKTSTPSSDDKATPNKLFQWNIDQKAVLYPADIDEMPNQQSTITHDHETENNVQSQIDTFFKSGIIAPSPWSGAKEGKGSVLRGINSEDKSASPACTSLSGSLVLPGKRSVSCQTALSIPMDLDLQRILGEYYTQNDSDDGSQDVLSTSSLRRKLFFQGESSQPLSPVKQEKISSDQSEGLHSPNVSPLKCVTPEQQKYSATKTPNSMQFSSSPKIVHKGTSNMATPVFQRCSIGSGDHFSSPELSPIGHDRKMKTPGSDGSEDVFAIPPIPAGLSKNFECTPSGGDHKNQRPDSPKLSPIKFSFTVEDKDEDNGDIPGIEKMSATNNTFTDENEHPRYAMQMEMDEEHESTSRCSTSDTQQKPCGLSTIKEFSNTDMECTNQDTASHTNLTNQDTGYQTCSLQMTNQDTGQFSNSANQEIGQFTCLTNQKPVNGNTSQEYSQSSEQYSQDEEGIHHTDLTTQMGGLPMSSNSDTGLDSLFEEEKENYFSVSHQPQDKYLKPRILGRSFGMINTNTDIVNTCEAKVSSYDSNIRGVVPQHGARLNPRIIENTGSSGFPWQPLGSSTPHKVDMETGNLQ